MFLFAYSKRHLLRLTKDSSNNHGNVILTCHNEAYGMAEVQGASFNTGRQSNLKIDTSNNRRELITSPNEAYGMAVVQGECFNAERQSQPKMEEIKTSSSNEAYGMVEAIYEDVV